MIDRSKKNDGMNATQRYQAKCDAITIRPLKAEGQKIRETADKMGFDSVTKFIMAAIKEYTEKHIGEIEDKK